MIFSIFAGKVLTKFNNICENKSPEGGHKGNLPQNNKGHIWKSHSKHHSQWWQAEIIPSKLFRKKKKIQVSPLLPPLFNRVLVVLAKAIREEKEKKGIQIRKELKLSLFTDDVTLYLENPKEATGKLLELINGFGKVAWDKINWQSSFAFLCISNTRSEREIEETIPFTIATKRTKYLVINLMRQNTSTQ